MSVLCQPDVSFIATIFLMNRKGCNNTTTFPVDEPSSIFLTIYYRRQAESEKIRTVLQVHSEGSSLGGVSRTTNLAYNTVVSLIRVFYFRYWN